MGESRSYATVFDALGFYLERAGAADILVNEIDGGFLLGFLTGQTQRVVTMDGPEIARLQAEVARHKEGGGFRLFGRKAAPEMGMRVRLRAMGRFLDERRAEAVVVQQRTGGFSSEFTSVPSDAADLRAVHRLTETLDDAALTALG